MDFRRWPYIYGYETLNELLEVIKTFENKPYIHYKSFEIYGMQKIPYYN